MMLMQKDMFHHLKSLGGYRAILPGSKLIEAQSEPVWLEADDGNRFSLTDTPWYDQQSISGREGGIYGNIEHVKFDPDAIYSVFFIHGTKVPYMFAVRQPE
jgi:hypothetical protein